MQDIQFKSTISSRSQICNDVDYRPDIPVGTLDMFSRAFKAWEIRRGLSEPSFMKSLRGIAARKQKQVENASKASAKVAPSKKNAKPAKKKLSSTAKKS